MNAESKDFLKQLVETPSPSGYEHEVQKVVRFDFYGAAAPSRSASPGAVSGRHGAGTSNHLTRHGNQGCVY